MVRQSFCLQQAVTLLRSAPQDLLQCRTILTLHHGEHGISRLPGNFSSQRLLIGGDTALC